MARKKRRRKSKKNNELKILIVLVLIALAGFGIKKMYDKGYIGELNLEFLDSNKNLEIIDLNSTTRPIGVMIDNVNRARPQAGLNDAYLIYEIIVEGGYTRLFALFKDANTQMIGPIRSVRHYFLDYALENDAILVHFGYSPQAQVDIKSLGINNLNGLDNSGNMFYRDSTLTKAPHNAFTNIEKINTQSNEKKYNKKVKDTLLNYSFDEIDLSSREDAIDAKKISIKYSYIHETSYEYDSENKVYKRFIDSNIHYDRITNEQYTTKNIIVYNVKNYALDDIEDKDRQELENIGTGNGYFITNGYAIPITYEKKSREDKTIYKDMKGKEIKVNDGNTYIQIQPIEYTTVIE